MMNSRCTKRNGTKINEKEFFLWKHKGKKDNTLPNFN